MEYVRGTSTVSKSRFLAYTQKLNALTTKMRVVIELAFALEPHWGIRADILLSQIFKETGYGKKGMWWENNNFAGLGVTGTINTALKETRPAYVPGTDWIWNEEDKLWHQGWAFKDELAGLNALFGHHVGYTQSEFSLDANRVDPRYGLLYNARKGKKPAILINDYNDQWAVTRVNGVIVPNRYGEDICTILYAIRDFAGEPVTLPADYSLPIMAAPSDKEAALLWVAMSQVIDELNVAYSVGDDVFKNQIYGRLERLKRSDVPSNWPNNMAVTSYYFKIRNAIIEQANAFYVFLKPTIGVK